MKRLSLILILLTAVFILPACTPLPEAAFSSGQPSAPDADSSGAPATAAPAASAAESPTDMPAASQLEIRVNGQTFPAVPAGNAAAEMFVSLLPASFEMAELNGNEKYCRLPDTRFPVEPTVPERICAGDICIYQDNCLVLFYETFETSYAYTQIGRITDPDGLAEALGSGDVRVEISLAAPQQGT